MVNVNDFLTDEQIGMLINEISSNDMVVLFFMDDREKIDYLLNRKKVWSSSYDYYNKQFDAFSNESLLYKDSDKEKYLVSLCILCFLTCSIVQILQEFMIFFLNIFDSSVRLCLNFIFLHFSLFYRNAVRSDLIASWLG